ncbi:hypothetical protein TNCV_3930541 [Trichonephila clavipes]|nr:hypothetical protein TNCV_3930541 [Trichonephila clavipes]
MHNATAQQPPHFGVFKLESDHRDVAGKSGFANKHNVVPFHCSCPEQFIIIRSLGRKRGDSSEGMMVNTEYVSRTMQHRPYNAWAWRVSNYQSDLGEYYTTHQAMPSEVPVDRWEGVDGLQFIGQAYPTHALLDSSPVSMLANPYG